jgi:hypothetical protein
MNHRHSTDEPKPPSKASPQYLIRTLLRTMAALALGYVLLLAYLHYTSEAELRRIFGGSNGLAALRSADHVEAYRIDNSGEAKSSPSARLADYAVLAGPVAVSEADVEKLRGTLDDKNTFRHLKKACLPQPGVRLDFIHGDDRLSVLLCFECDMAMNFLNGSFVGGGDFDDARPALVAAVRSLFPNDPKIQALTEQR